VADDSFELPFQKKYVGFDFGSVRREFATSPGSKTFTGVPVFSVRNYEMISLQAIPS
jgi:hypothetical protein